MEDAVPSLQQARETLSRSDWLSACPPAFAVSLLAAGMLRHLQPGEFFNLAGDMEGGMWGIVRGQASALSGMNRPGAPVSLVLHQGQWGGTAPVFGFARIGDCSARTPASILVIPHRALKRLLDETPAWWEHLGALNFRTLRQYGALAVDLQIPDSRQRMAAVLLHAAGLRFGGDAAVTVAITQDELGLMANLSRYPAGQHLRAFARAGLVSLGYRQATLLDPFALRAIADQV